MGLFGDCGSLCLLVCTEGMSTVLFEACQNFAVDASEFTTACCTLLHFTTLPLIVDWLNRLFVVMVRKLGQASTMRNVRVITPCQ